MLKFIAAAGLGALTSPLHASLRSPSRLLLRRAGPVARRWRAEQDGS